MYNVLMQAQLRILSKGSKTGKFFGKLFHTMYVFFFFGGYFFKKLFIYFVYWKREKGRERWEGRRRRIEEEGRETRIHIY